jgi:DNA-binding MarR family transcriptional regulator
MLLSRCLRTDSRTPTNRLSAILHNCGVKKLTPPLYEIRSARRYGKSRNIMKTNKNIKASQARILILSILYNNHEIRPSKHDFTFLPEIVTKTKITDMDFIRSVINSLYEDKYINMTNDPNNPISIGIRITKSGIIFFKENKNILAKIKLFLIAHWKWVIGTSFAAISAFKLFS